MACPDDEPVQFPISILYRYLTKCGAGGHAMVEARKPCACTNEVLPEDLCQQLHGVACAINYGSLGAISHLRRRSGSDLLGHGERAATPGDVSRRRKPGSAVSETNTSFRKLTVGGPA